MGGNIEAQDKKDTGPKLLSSAVYYSMRTAVMSIWLQYNKHYSDKAASIDVLSKPQLSNLNLAGVLFTREDHPSAEIMLQTLAHYSVQPSALLPFQRA